MVKLIKKSMRPFKDQNNDLSSNSGSDDFFDQYMEFYQKFIEFGSGKRLIKQKGKWIEVKNSPPNPDIMNLYRQFHDPEKAFREDVKKMLEQLLLLQFLQIKKEFKIHFPDKTPFKKNNSDHWTNQFPKEYFEDLFNMFSRFHFTLDENDRDIKNTGIDPEMLGRIFEIFLEDNKEKGAFYTPKEIVRHMCRESLIAYLGDTPLIRKLFADPPDTTEIAATTKTELLKKLRQVKICDPAIGSGAFPMGMLDLLIRTREALGEIIKDNKPAIAAVKKEIIENNIYGIDIDSDAVDIARLRFWFSLAVDQETLPPLSHLNCKIRQGNSLLEQIEEDHSKFDIVIGNPPYMDSETMSRIMPDQRKLLRSIYPNLSGNWDLYMAFWELAGRLSQNIFLYITPNKWLSKPFGKNFRKNFVRTKLYSIFFCGKGVFKNVFVDAVVSLFQQKNQITTFGKFDSSGKEKIITKSSLENLTFPYYIDHYFSENYPLIEKIQRRCVKRIKELMPCENACATHDAYVLIPLIENRKEFVSEQYYKLVNTGTIEKFHSRWGEANITYLKRKILYPVVDRTVFSEHLGRTFQRRASMPKIILKGLNFLDAFADLNGEYIPGKTTLCLCSENQDDLKWLCAILNSDLIFFQIRETVSSSSYCGGISFSPDIINGLLIPEFSLKEKTNLIRIVDGIITGQQSAEEGLKKINETLFSLCDLMPDEVNLIKESLPKRSGRKRDTNRK